MVDGVGGGPNDIHSIICRAEGSCAPGSSVQVHNNTVETQRYKILLTNNKDDHAVTIIDKLTGKKAYVGGDPHVSTGDGDWTSFQNGNLTINLDDGTKLTFDPTNNPGGPTYLDRLTVTNGDDAAVVNFGSNNGNPTVEARPGQANRLDRRTPDGLELRTTHGSLDDLRVIGGPEIRGNNIDDLDVYRGGQRWGNRPDIGYPGWRHDGPSRGWDFARHDHDYGHHHDHGRHHDNNCGPITPEIRHLLDRLADYQRQARHGSWFARADARHHIDRIEHRLRELRA